MGNSWVWWWAQANRGENNAHHLNNESINKAGCNPASSLTRTTTPNKEWCRWTAPTVSPRQRVQSTSPQPNSLLPILDHSMYSGKHEYEPGIGRKKAAKHFARAERGKSKFTYGWRKIAWDRIKELLLAGHTAEDVAINMICQAYGVGTSVTSIINLICDDRKE